MLPVRKEPDPLVQVHDHALMTLAKGKLVALEARQKILLGTELANESLTRLTRLYENGQRIAAKHPELEGMVNDLTLSVAMGVKRVITSYLNPGDDLMTFEGGWIYD